jgi:hypothetical protein
MKIELQCELEVEKYTLPLKKFTVPKFLCGVQSRTLFELLVHSSELLTASWADIMFKMVSLSFARRCNQLSFFSRS